VLCVSHKVRSRRAVLGCADSTAEREPYAGSAASIASTISGASEAVRGRKRFTSPPGSTACRLKAWGSGFTNLTLAGDWIYTGLNVGSFEGTVMSGKLASHALTGFPALDTIYGYPAPRPA